MTRSRWTFHHSQYEAQGAAALEAIELAQSVGRGDLVTEARLWLGKGLTWEGKHQAAREALDAALAGARALGQRRLITESLRYLAIVASNVSEFAQARALLADVIAIHREDDDEEGEAVALVQLASVLFNEGRFADARRRSSKRCRSSSPLASAIARRSSSATWHRSSSSKASWPTGVA